MIADLELEDDAELINDCKENIITNSLSNCVFVVTGDFKLVPKEDIQEIY